MEDDVKCKCRIKKERERIAQEVDSQTQTSSPGGADGRGGSGWGGKLSALLHVHRGSRASSRKSSRSSDVSDLSEIGTSALLFPNLPLLLLSGATGTHEDLQPPALTVSRPSPTAEQPSAASSSGSDSITVRYCWPFIFSYSCFSSSLFSFLTTIYIYRIVA